MALSALTDIRSFQYVVLTILSSWIAQWWRFLQDTFPSLAVDYSKEIRVLFENDHVLLHVFKDDKWEILYNFTNNEAQKNNLTYELSRAVSAINFSRDVTLIIPEIDILRPRLQMPRTRKNVLRQALQYEVGRLSPIDPAKLYYDFTAETADEISMQQVSLRIVNRSKMDEIVAQCHAAGLNIAEVVFSTDSKPADRTAFPVDRNAVQRLVWRRYSTLILCVFFLFLFFATMAADYAREVRSLNILNDEIAKTQLEATQVERMQHRIAASEHQFKIAAERKRSPTLVETLSGLTDALPDTTWISEFEMTGKRIRIQGTAATASELVERIDRSGAFYDAQFEAPVVQDTANKKEHFDLSFAVSEIRK